MREQKKLYKHQTPQERMVRIKKKIQIRKQKLYGIPLSISNIKEINIQCSQPIHSQSKESLTKQQKQKLKNREAAQKSRQQKKNYLIQLQDQIKRLKQKMIHCPQCRIQLQNFHSELQNTQDTNSREIKEIESIRDLEQQSQFIRVRSVSEDSSIGIYLFICMIVLGVFMVVARTDFTNSNLRFKRDLMQTFSNPVNKLYSDSEHANNNIAYSAYQKNSDSKKYENGLLSMDQVKSPTLISDDIVVEKIVDAFETYKINRYDQSNLRSKDQLVDTNKSLLFCNRPKIYQSQSAQNGILTTFLDIFVQGAEIINILPNTGQNKVASRNLQFSGLYKITALVEQIEQVPNLNFIY